MSDTPLSRCKPEDTAHRLVAWLKPQVRLPYAEAEWPQQRDWFAELDRRIEEVVARHGVAVLSQPNATGKTPLEFLYVRKCDTENTRRLLWRATERMVRAGANPLRGLRPLPLNPVTGSAFEIGRFVDLLAEQEALGKLLRCDEGGNLLHLLAEKAPARLLPLLCHEIARRFMPAWCEEPRESDGATVGHLLWRLPPPSTMPYVAASMLEPMIWSSLTPVGQWALDIGTRDHGGVSVAELVVDAVSQRRALVPGDYREQWAAIQLQMLEKATPAGRSGRSGLRL